MLSIHEQMQAFLMKVLSDQNYSQEFELVGTVELDRLARIHI